MHQVKNRRKLRTLSHRLLSRKLLFPLVVAASLSLRLVIISLEIPRISSFVLFLPMFMLFGVVAAGSREETENQPSDRLCGRCRTCNGLIVFSDDNGKTWRYYDGQLHKAHPTDFIPDPSVAPDLPKKRREKGAHPTSDLAVAYQSEEGLSLARDPALLYRIKLALDQNIFREDANKLLLFLICVSSLTGKPLSAGITSESAAGKSNLLHHVIDYFPNVDYFTRMTAASMDRLAKNLNGRILVVEELRGADAAQGTIRVAISEGKLRLLTTERDEKGKIATHEIETKGTPVFLTTTTSTAIDWETQTRFVMMSLDESSEQTKGVLGYEAKEYTDVKPKQKTNPVIGGFLATLVPYEILIPYAPQLVLNFPANRLSARRDFKKLLNLIALVAFVHQHQRLRVRKRDEPLGHRIVATPLDLRYALQIAGQSLRQNLAGVPSRVLALLQHFKEGQAQTTRSIAHAAKISQRTARRWLGEDLIQAGYLTVDETQKEHLYFLADQQAGDNPNLSLEISPEVLLWDPGETKDWLERQNFELLTDASDLVYVDPFTGNFDSSSPIQRPLTASQSEHEITVLHGQTAEITARPQVAAELSPNQDADNGQLEGQVPSAINKLRGLKSAPTLEHYIDFAETVVKNPEEARSLVDQLCRNGELIQNPEGHWTWAHGGS